MKTVCGSDEPHPYPIRSFTYRTEHIKADEVQTVTMYNINQQVHLIKYRSKQVKNSYTFRHLAAEETSSGRLITKEPV